MKMTLILSFFILMCTRCDSTPVYPAIYPDQVTVEDAQIRIHQLILDNVEIKQKSTGYPLIGGFVRLAFHDCVGEGSCDGCIDHAIPDNAGLKVYTNLLDPIYKSNYMKPLIMSRADFYAIASLVALTNSTHNLRDKFTGLDNGNFKVGRADCSKSPDEDEPDPGFPKGKFNNGELLYYFANMFGFTMQETVALMGAHSLGRCHGEYSGFHGPWKSGSNNGIKNSALLGNKYYEHLQGAWEQKNVLDVNGKQSEKIQWQKPNTSPNHVGINQHLRSVFLNADMSIAYDINPDSTGHVSCRVNCNIIELKNDPNCCQAASTNQIMQAYIRSNKKWIQDFQAVFLKMINKNENEINLKVPQVKKNKKLTKTLTTD